MNNYKSSLFLKRFEDSKLNKLLPRIVYPTRIIIGTFLIIFGVIGIILPIIPGWTPLILGVIIISPKQGKAFGRWVYKTYSKYITRFLGTRKGIKQ